MEIWNKEMDRAQTRCSVYSFRRAAIMSTVGLATILGMPSLALGNAAPQPVGNYSTDAITDMTVWRPSNGTWYWIDSTTGAAWWQQWGLPGDIPVSANYNYGSNDGSRSDITVWRPSDGTWHWIDSGTWNTWQFTWGQQGDIPLAGDFDGDGKSDIIVYRSYPDYGYPAASWFVVYSSNWTSNGGVQYGLPGDIPVPCDYDGDSITDYAIFRPSTGTWWNIDSHSGQNWYYGWGLQGDIPVPGDYDADGVCDFAVYRPSNGTWYVTNSSTWTYWTRQWGLAGDVPAPADYDGDHATDTVVWRPTNGYWYGIRSSNGSSWNTQWGTGSSNSGGIASDVAMPNNPGSKNWVDVIVRPQEQSLWCGAATTEMVAEYSHVLIDQCVEAIAYTGNPNCCANPSACNTSEWWRLTSHGFTEDDLWNAALTFDQLQAQVNGNRPVPFAWAWNGGSGHAMVLTKTWVTSSGTQWVSVNDPGPVNVGTQTDMLYTTWVSGSGYSHWRDSYNVTRQN